MRTAVITLLVTLAAAGTARADGFYFSEGFGAADVGSELGEYFDGSAAIRIAIGRRTGRWAVEGFVRGTFLEGRRFLAGGFYSMTTFGLSARHFYQLSEAWRGYLRGGFGRAEMSGGLGDDYGIDSYSGRSLHYGAGVQASGKVRALGFLFWPMFFAKIGPKVSASLNFEIDRQITRLHHPTGPSLDGRFTTWLMAFTIGGDF